MKEEATPTGTIGRGLAAFSSRLGSILGRGRIPRSEKKAKAEAAMNAVDDLVGALDEEIAGIEQRVEPTTTDPWARA